MEAVRLVIWDLDETFWNGTLTEGGMTYNQVCHDIVIELARRGIMSSICSKNDLDTVRLILEDSGIWDYFIFPSINWDPKGARVARIIEDAQLRPASVMLVDDNPMNLKEAQFFTPDLQVAAETFVADMLASPLFKGKDDRSLSRLKQYKLLETKAAEKARSGGDNTAFLRTSDIRVVFDYDVMSNLDRVIELINRTNQLNFTKRRLPEDVDAARADISALLSHYQTQAALIRVMDRYGDYGYVGFYAQKRDGRGAKLVHFCFSCRTLNMGIESWVYRHLGRPSLAVEGEVLTDVRNDPSVVDWIRIVANGEDGADDDGTLRKFDRIITHGGCDQRALAHYLTRHADIEVGEYNISRHGLQLRTDNSWVLRHALDGLPATAVPDIEALGYKADDFQTEINQLSGTNNLVLLSFWMDNTTGLLRHKTTGTIIPFSRRELEDRFTKEPNAFYARAREVVAETFEPIGLIKDDIFRANVERAIDAIGGRAEIVLVTANTVHHQKSRSATNLRSRQNAILHEFGKTRGNVRVIDVESFINNASEAQSTNHFDRMVYYRIYKAIIDRVKRSEMSGLNNEKAIAVAAS